MEAVTTVATREQTWGELGPAMRALNDRYRAFVEFYLLEKPGRGAQTAAARRAGFGTPRTTALSMAQIAYRLMRDERIVAAIAEESRKLLRAGAPDAVKALRNMVNDPAHKDHARAVAMLLDRSDPIVTHQQIDVTHKHVDPDTEAIEELRALRQLGTSREKLIELFGGNGLARLEVLEAADAAQRAQSAKVIEGKVIDEEPDNGKE
jgi:phage terminase small subunit